MNNASSSLDSADGQAPQPVLSLENVTIELQGETILKDINLRLYPGEVAVLIGPSGGGKTVLLKTMAGLFEPKVGRVLCYGHEWKKLSLTERHQLAAKIGMQFQQSALFDELTAFENISFVLKEHSHMSESEIGARVIECLAAVGLEKSQNLHEYELSGGMKKRLGIARAIALKPDILFLDDPTAGLDPVNSDNMAELILDLKMQIHATMAVVTHDILRAYQLAGRIFLVADQAVIETGNAQQTQKHPDPRVQQFIHGWLNGPLSVQ
jgi:phospholipid/cholesterol/gamma-HCH transport system ATP-binding protein